MSIRLRKVNRINETPTPLEGYTSVNCVSWFPTNVLRVGASLIPIYQVSPYHLKDNECIFENVWQSAKLYQKVTKQEQKVGSKETWTHPEETHVDAKGEPNAVYWSWRIKLSKHHEPVRYPNGRDGAASCICAIWCFDGINVKRLTYFEARWEIYVKRYGGC